MSRPKRSLRDLHNVRSMIADIGVGEALRTINDTTFSRKLCHGRPSPAAPGPIQYGNGVRVTIVVRWFASGDFHHGLARRSPASSSGALSFTLGESAVRLVKKKRSTWSKSEVTMRNDHMV
eukprot:1018406-Pyramimonas_sp.AAC.1